MKKLILLSLILFSFLQSNAQNNFTLDVSLEYADTITLKGDSVFDVYCDIVVTDVSDISAVIISAGSTSGTSDIFSYKFPFDDNNLPGNMEWQRTGNNISIKLGIQVLHARYYYQTRLVDQTEAVSTPETFY